MKIVAGLAILISVVCGSFSSTLDFECYLDNRPKCNESLIPTAFPETGEELSEICENVQTHGSCLVGVRESCGEVDSELNTRIRETVDYLSKACDEDYPDFKVISNNLQCIKPVYLKIGKYDRDCVNNMSEKNQDLIYEVYLNYYEPVYRREVVTCLDYLTRKTCLIMQFRHHCGADVGEAAEQIVLNTQSRQQRMCTEDILEELEPFLHTFEDMMVEELERENKNDKRK